MNPNTKKAVISVSLAGVILFGTTHYLIKGTGKVLNSAKYSSTICKIFNYDRTEKVIKDFKDCTLANPEFAKEYYDGQTEGEDFMEKFTPYLKRYSKYISSEQLVTFQEGLISDYEVKEHATSDVRIDLYNIMLSCLGNEKGYGSGFNKAYITFVVKDCFGYGSILDDDKLYWLFEKLTNVLTRDKVAELMWSQNIDTLISELQQAYLLEDTKLLDELIKAFDSANEDNLDYKEERELIVNADTIYRKILKNKLDKDPNHIKTLRGRIDQNYLNGNEDSLTLAHLEEEGITYRISDPTYEYLTMFNVEGVIPEATLEIGELSIKYANQLLIDEAMDPKYHKVLELLSYIIDWDVIGKFNKTNSLDIIWPYFENYFETKEELARFIIGLKNVKEPAVVRYFEIVTDKITTGTPDYKKLAEFEELKYYYLKNTYPHINDEKMNLVYNPEDILIDSEEAKKYTVLLEDYTFAEVNPNPYFNKIANYFNQSDLKFTTTNRRMYEVRDYMNGEVTYKDIEEFEVYKASANVEIRGINNQYYYFFRIPEGYEEVECVRLKQTLDNKFVEVPVQGIVTEFHDYENGITESVYLVHLGNKLENEIEPVLFKTKASKIITKEVVTGEKGTSYTKSIPNNH